MRESLPAIFFQGKPLPVAAYQLDLLAVHALINGLTEEQSVWWWRFTICVGCNRSDLLSTILQNAKILQDQLIGDPKRVAVYLEKKCPNYDPDVLINEWKQSLEIIIDEAKNAQRCTWFAEEISSES